MGLSFKEFEHEAWQKAAYPYDTSFSRLTQQMIPALLRALEIREGTHFLDVACGPGHLAAAAYQKGAKVEGVDFSSSMLSRAKQLYPSIDFSEGDAEELQKYPNAHFDAVGMNFGIIHLGEPENALKAARRVLKTGGKVAFTAWRPPQEAIGFSLVLRAIEMYGNPHVELPTAPPLFFYSEPERCVHALLQCGFTNPQTQIVPQTWELHAPDEVFEAFLKGTARTAGLLKGQSVEQLEAIRKALCNFVSEHMHQGKITIPMPALIAWATKSLD